MPILQRLLEEQDKASNMGDDMGEEAGRFEPKGFLRALIITPTRELAIQVVIILNEILSADHEFSNMLLDSANLSL